MPSNTSLEDQIVESRVPCLLKPVIIKKKIDKPKKSNHMDKSCYT
jgi:hypothetical protein